MSWNVQQTPHATEVSNLALNYLCKLAGCTLNVQPVNLHKFFSHCKARHDLSAYTKSKGKTCQQFELLLLPKLIILNQEYPFLYFLKILTGHQEKKKKDRVFVKSGKLYPGCYANFKQWQWYLNFKHISRQALRG